MTNVAAVGAGVGVGSRGLPEQSRARYPDFTGHVERGGVRTFYEVYGEGSPTVLLLPPWSIVHSRTWKGQIPFLSRFCRVIAFDGRGNGRSDRPTDPVAYAEQAFADDALAVLDATDTADAVVVGFSLGAQRGILLAGQHPDRVSRLVLIAPAVPVSTVAGPRSTATFEAVRDRYEGWQKFNRHHWMENYEDFVRFFFSQVYTEPHSTKQVEDCVGWALESSPEVMVATQLGQRIDSEDQLRRSLSLVRCPALVVHGTNDGVSPYASGAALAEMAGWELATLEGSGHAPHSRDPVKVNLMLRDVLGPAHKSWTRGRSRKRRALFVSSPIGLGHAQRDIAIADELRRLVPELEVDWLAQHPVSTALEAKGERVHPASSLLASESGHIESESAEHDLHCFRAWRRMDEILVANFMNFHDVVEGGSYDLWVGDEAWDIDYFLHENPELKRAAYVWLTDFVGWLPMPDGGEEEVLVTADYNAEMIGQIERYPRVRDQAIFVGDVDDIVPDDFGPGLPSIRDWTEEHFDCAGYVTGFDPARLTGREALRADLGYREGELVCLVTVGGSGVGIDLLRRVITAYPEAKRLVPELRMLLVAGPRIEPSSLGPLPEDLDVHAYVPELYRHLAACDIAVVQGGLTTTMELTANRKPFLYFPLRHHFEQNFHVRHRLERYGAGVAMDYAHDGPGAIATAIASHVRKEVDYRPVDPDGAARVARSIAELL